MRTLYIAARILGYVAGLAGLALLLWTRSRGVFDSPWRTAGLALIGIGFLAFLITYILFAADRILRAGRRFTPPGR